MFDFSQAPPRNHLLSALSADVQSRLSPHLAMVPLEAGRVLHECGDPACHVYFPTDAVVSVVHVLSSGATMELSSVGHEGLIGTASFMGGASTRVRATVQCAGHAYRIPVTPFGEEFDRHGELMSLMLRYTQSLAAQITLAAACNRHHRLDQQVCCWLLRHLDRSPSNRLFATQEAIANSLGVRREGITRTVRILKHLGAIECCRGQIRVLDRFTLEKLSCECYAVVKQETHRLLPHVAHALDPRLESRDAAAQRRLPVEASVQAPKSRHSVFDRHAEAA